MPQEINLTIRASKASPEIIRFELARLLKVRTDEIAHVQTIRKSIDARSKQIKFNFQFKVYLKNEKIEPPYRTIEYPNVSHQKPVLVIGAGPAGYFAALQLIENNIKPIVIERGKDVQARRHDIAKLYRQHIVDPDSNYSFGEGGAGTFSDGKLYTRSKKRGNVEKIIQILHQHGAADEILFEAHPHIGTNKLPAIIRNMRQTIISSGGEVHFGTRVTDFLVQHKQIQGVKTTNGDFKANHVILATGHSARDIFRVFHQHNFLLEAKSFAMGVRVEHPQNLIDNIQYSCAIREDYLPAAAYSLVQQVDKRGVYSFCMCPGGHIVPAGTEPKQIVVNGMSPSGRNSKFANSGIVVELKLEDIPNIKNKGAMAGILFQNEFEKMAFHNAGPGITAPAQRLIDFIDGKHTRQLPQSTYTPGLVSSDMHQWMPKHIRTRLQKGFTAFERKMKGFLTNEALIIGVESRTSSPVRIPRNDKTLQHPQINGLFPCGEGAGYAGGIVSSAIDGVLCAYKIAELG